MKLQRHSDVFFFGLLFGMLLLVLLFFDANMGQELDQEKIRVQQAMVRILTLTDLSLCTEARYTRHPSLADWHTPFQDHPLALEHFPSGTLIIVPPHLKSRPEDGD
jgi:hypothetical protein